MNDTTNVLFPVYQFIQLITRCDCLRDRVLFSVNR